MEHKGVSFGKMVAALAKPGAELSASLDPMKAHVLHMAIGISGEAGELLDNIEKSISAGKSIDFENATEDPAALNNKNKMQAAFSIFIDACGPPGDFECVI